jgi:hypothetical protein
MRKTTYVAWPELDAVLEERGFLLIDVSAQSRIPGMSTVYSLSYLAQLMNGTYRGPDGPGRKVIHALATVLKVPKTAIRPKNWSRVCDLDDQEPEALARAS